MKLRESLFTRRQFLNALLGSAAGTFSATVLAPIARFLWPSQARPLPPLVVLPREAYPLSPGEGRMVDYGGRPALLLRTKEGDLRAFLAICTHLNCTVGYRPDQQDIWCECHRGRFNLEGQVLAGPPPRPLERFVVEERGPNLILARAGVDIEAELKAQSRAPKEAGKAGVDSG